MELRPSPGLRRLLLIGPPAAYALLLVFHPIGEGAAYEVIRDRVTRWQVVHVAQLIFIGLLATSLYLLTAGMGGRAALTSRAALLPFVLFYGAFEAVTGIGTGVLVDHANGLPSAEQAVAADLIQAYWDNRLAGNFSVAMALGVLAWVVALGAAALALRRAGVPRSVPVLLVLAAVLFGISHAPPLGPLGLALLVAAIVRLERAPQRLGAPVGERRMRPTPG